MGASQSIFERPEVTDGVALNEFVRDHVQLRQEEKERFNQSVDEIVRFLQARDPSFPWSIKRVVKSGSLKRGTAVRGHADVDLVCFIERCPNKGLTNHEKFLQMREQIIDDIANKFGKAFKWKYSWLWGWQGEAEPYTAREFLPLFNYKNVFMLNLKLVKSQSQRSFWNANDVVDLDVILGYDLMQEFGDLDSIYNLFARSPRLSNDFSPSLAEIQRDFMVDRLNRNNNNNLKKLMLLVKFWVKTEVPPVQIKFPSYLVELVCLHVWETNLVGNRYNLATWFKQVMEAFRDYKSLDGVWEEVYSLHSVPQNVANQRPLMLDPANPFQNVAQVHRLEATWEAIKQCADAFLRSV